MSKNAWPRVVRGSTSGVLVTIILLLSVVVPAAAVTAIATGGPFTYVEQASPLPIGTGSSVSGGNFYDGQYIDFEITGATADETLALQSVSTPVTTVDVVSVVGTAVYVGDGSNAIPIGSVDSVSDGQGGTKLRVNFGSDFRNASFETGAIAPWTAVEAVVDLGVTEIAGFTTVDTSTYPINCLGQVDGDSIPHFLGSYSVAVSTSAGATEGAQSLKLESTGVEMWTIWGEVAHGPAAYSAPFDAVDGQTLSFDWRAFAGNDAYAVFGYLLNTSSGEQTEVLDAFTTNTSGETNWAEASVSVPSTGTYRFVFVSGTYDATCGSQAGASLHVDNFQVSSTDLVDDAMVSSVAELLTYENTSDDPVAVRTVTMTAQSVAEGVDSGTIMVNITAVNDPPVGTAISEQWENNLTDTYDPLVGTASFIDPDDSSLAYSIVGGTPGTYSLGGVGYDHSLAGTYGTLYVDEATGDYRIVANGSAIQAVSNPIAESFTISAFDGTDSGTATLSLEIVPQPAPRNVVGVSGDGEVTVSWTIPTSTTGITGYVATAAPGGQTCTTGAVDVLTCDVTGLTNGTAYTFTVQTIIGGETGGTVSLASGSVTPTGTPGVPLVVVGTQQGDGRVLMSWNPPASDGGEPITGYTVTSPPGTDTCSTAGATSCTVLGLAIGTTYSFIVHATNANGDGADSDPVSVAIKYVSATSVASSATSISVGDTVVLTATVTTQSSAGDVEFFDGGTSLGTASITAGQATLTTGPLGAGPHNITAVYAGDSVVLGSTSSPIAVTAPTTAAVSLTASSVSPVSGESVTFTATVTGSSPSGTVELFDGTTSLGTGTVSAGGVATFATAALTIGGHTISAVYSGDTTNTAATSDELGVTVKTVPTPTPTPTPAPTPEPVSHVPSGSSDSYATANLEELEPGPNEIRVHGWSFDPDLPTKDLVVHVYVFYDGVGDPVTGEPVALGTPVVRAADFRPDVNRAFGIGGDHGFNRTLAIRTGNHRVCVYSLSVDETGTHDDLNQLIGCRYVTITDEAPPRGAFDVATQTGTSLNVSGWAYDLDSETDSLDIQVYLDGAYYKTIKADGVRADVNKIVQISGNHGFNSTFTVPAGGHQVCVYAVGVDPTGAADGENVLLDVVDRPDCRTT